MWIPKVRHGQGCFLFLAPLRGVTLPFYSTKDITLLFGPAEDITPPLCFVKDTDSLTCLIV